LFDHHRDERGHGASIAQRPLGLGTEVTSRNAAFCGLSLDDSCALPAKGLVICKCGSRQREVGFRTPEASTRAPRLHSSCPEALFRAASVPALGAQRRRVGTRAEERSVYVLGSEQSDRPPSPRGTVEGGSARQ